MWPVAQTSLQLYNQLRARGWSQAELSLVHRAYELTVSLYSGYFQNDGKPFVAHTVGVASILAHLGRPCEVVAAGLLHNVYTNADFGDGRIFNARTARRRLVKAHAGEAVEAIVFHFLRDMRLKSRLRVYDQSRPQALTSVAPDIVLIDIADALEKHVDGGILYASDREALLAAARQERGELIAASLRLGYPELAAALTEAIDMTLATATKGYAYLQPTDRRRYLRLIVPRSCFELPQVVLRARLRNLRNRLRALRWRRGAGKNAAVAVAALPMDESLQARGDSGPSVL